MSKMHGHSGRVAGCRIGRGLLLFCVCLLWTWTLLNGTMTTFCIKVLFFICIPLHSQVFLILSEIHTWMKDSSSISEDKPSLFQNFKLR